MTRKRVLRICFILFFFVFLVSGVVLAWNAIRYKRESDANASLADLVHEADSDLPAPGPGEGESAHVSDMRYRPIVDQNPETGAWLTAYGIGVDLPVMCTPSDPEKYLRLSFDGEYAVSGSLFLGEGCLPDEGNIIVYGHHMRNGTMFGSLDSYANKDFADSYPYITYDILHEDGSYERVQFEVMAAFYTKIYPASDTDAFRYYAYTDISDPDVLNEYYNQVMRITQYDRGVRPQPGDRLLTLSTCSYHTTDGRFVVVACEVGG